MRNGKKELKLVLIVIAASLLILIGISLSFIDLNQISIKENNDGYVSAIFSLTGVILYFTALMYQIKEYRLQVIELQKSVKAQTKSSEALDEQKRILIEQNANNLIFGMISNLNDFKSKYNFQNISSNIVSHFQDKFATKWKMLNSDDKLSDKELNEKFAHDIKLIFTKEIKREHNYLLYKQTIQFIYNILFTIDENRQNFTRDNFTSLLHVQLDNNESILLYLSNLVDSDAPIYHNLKWGFHETKSITDMIKSHDKTTSFKRLDIEIMMKTFQKIKQNN